MKALSNKKAIVLGLGISGLSAMRFLRDRGAHVVGFDDRDPVPLDWMGVDLVVVSPGVPRNHRHYRHARDLGIEVIGEAELAFRFLKQRILGITGTNGKTTVTLLVAHVLNHCGKPAKACGNVGVPLTAVAGDEIIVAELSSYQLETMATPALDAAMILNITPDHLDRYASFEEYATTKIHIADCLASGGSLFVHEKVYRAFSRLLTCHSPRVITDEKVETIVPVGYRGENNHDRENLLAAYALCQELGVSAELFGEAVQSFQKPPHRMQFVCDVEGVRYYDDSKGTNVDAVISAVQAMPGPVFLIAGGVDKGCGYQSWIEPFAGRVKQIFAIGEAAPKIAEELSKTVPVTICESMEMAVTASASAAQTGDCVLLSPGCASFDMFENYQQRGKTFQEVVSYGFK